MLPVQAGQGDQQIGLRVGHAQLLGGLERPAGHLQRGTALACRMVRLPGLISARRITRERECRAGSTGSGA
ncbi:hypothetical protein GCM10009601_26820 [Streptomyces thermospinosisporus]|uniref:Uncharacterized protein n=1 Tax=Streptomyces thermospinosisporus TaxID=161482 RepID=A0ABP4JJF9_9ACTN